MTVHNFEELDAEQMRIAAAGVVAVPFEQSSAWEAFSVTQGHPCWGRFAWYEGDRRIAVIALYEYSVRNWRFLWAKFGPVWLKEATPAREAALRADLRRLVAERDKSIAFVRLNAWYQAPDIEPVIQTITYDRTVRIMSFGGDAEAMLEYMPNSGRRSIRKAMRRAEEFGFRVVEEHISSVQDFVPFYKVMEETAERDGFRPHPQQVYVDLLTSIGPEKAKLYSVRDAEDNLLCWDLVLVHDKEAQVPYGASTGFARKHAAPTLLDFKVTEILGRDMGVKSLDLMGIHSPRSPELFGVGHYKLAFAPTYTDVPSGWDMPIKRTTFGLMKFLKNIKDRLG